MSELISIIVPVYNVAPYIADCVDSILFQSYRDIELILVDDGSTDYSGMICDRYAQQDSRVRVFHLQNGGVSSARNYGMKQVTGDYIMFVDSDDTLADNALERIGIALTHNADVMIFGNCIIRDGIRTEHVPEAGLFNREEFGRRYIELYTQFFINSPWNKVYKRKKIDDTMTFPETMSLGEDMMFCNSYLRKCDSFLLLDEPLYVYKIRGEQSLSIRYYDNLFDLYCIHYWDVVKTMNTLDSCWKRENCVALYRMYLWYIKQSINMTSHPQNYANVRERYREIKRICRHPFTKECVAHVQSTKVYDIFLGKQYAVGILLYINGSKIKSRIKKRGIYEENSICGFLVK